MALMVLIAGVVFMVFINRLRETLIWHKKQQIADEKRRCVRLFKLSLKAA